MDQKDKMKDMDQKDKMKDMDQKDKKMGEILRQK